jgi:hypothetical protein
LAILHLSPYNKLYDTRVCTRYVTNLVYVLVLLIATDKIMNIFDPNLSCPLSTIRVQHHHTLMDIFDPNRTSVGRYQPFAYNATHFVLSSYTSLSFLENTLEQTFTYNATDILKWCTSLSILQKTFKHLRTKLQFSVFNHLRTTQHILLVNLSVYS